MNGIPPRPSGDDAEARFMQWLWDSITKHQKLVSVPGQIEFSYTSKGIVPRIISSGGIGSGGIDWATPKEYDKTKSYGVNKLVWLSETNTAVTTGVTDPDSGLPVKSEPGLYLSLQPVAPIAGPAYHIPQAALPDSAIAGTTNYWLWLTPIANCA